MAYEPRPGTVAFRSLAYLETLPPGAEVMTSKLAEAIGEPANNVTPCLEAARLAGRLYRRQRDDHVRSPYWWSLTDRSAEPRPPAPRVEPVFVANGATTDAGAAQAGPALDAGSVQRGVAQLAARRAHNPEVGGSSPPPASIRIALWSDGVLHISGSRTGQDIALAPDETRALLAYLDRLAS